MELEQLLLGHAAGVRPRELRPVRERRAVAAQRERDQGAPASPLPPGQALARPTVALAAALTLSRVAIALRPEAAACFVGPPAVAAAEAACACMGAACMRGSGWQSTCMK